MKEILDKIEFEPISKYNKFGNEIQTAKFNYKGIDVYEETFIPYNIFKNITVIYTIDLLLPIGENIEQGPYCEEGYGSPMFNKIEDSINFINNYKNE
jgi:hypothetical protein